MKPLVLVVLAGTGLALAQTPSTLTTRFKKLSCAIVQIKSGNESGTGFFINDSGTIATAAHVVFDTEYSGTLQDPIVTINPKNNVTVRTIDAQDKPVELQRLSTQDAERATADVALFESHLKPLCHLQIGDASIVQTGDTLIAIGYPSASPDPTLYQGFLSSRSSEFPVPVATYGNVTLQRTFTVFRIQMPITAGASGSPVIDEDDRVVGIVSQL